MSLVLINNSAETFTPTASGAIATFIWECCQAAKTELGNHAASQLAREADPWVITARSSQAPYAHAQTIFLDYPPVSQHQAAQWLWRAERKWTGWRHLRQGTYARRVMRAIQAQGLQQYPLVLHNDPELALYLREHFPEATIVQHFHNQLESKPTARQKYASARIISTAVSNFTARWVEHYYGLPGQSVRAIYNGVDAQRFCPIEAAGITGSPAADCVLNFVGRTGREKAPDLLLRAALQLSAETRNFAVQIIGSNHWNRFELDDYQRELNTLAEQLTQRGIAVHRLGHVDRGQMPAKIRAAHIHVVPSRWDEPFGLTTLEGMASGLATIGSDTGGTPEIIAQSGLLFARDSVEELTAQLHPLVTNAQLRQHYGSLARQRAEQFSWARTWNTLRAVTRV